ncbi:hypothetical protein DFH27DRAFT_181849 [Peziza echinospora]|nr:hypothetical protein DFH27DRAFT_181849 [Peziza echinospora]
MAFSKLFVLSLLASVCGLATAVPHGGKPQAPPHSPGHGSPRPPKPPVTNPPVPGHRATTTLYDGRVPLDFTLAELDSYSTSLFGAEYVLGAGQKWSEVVVFPSVTPSLFDGTKYKPLEVTINDKSIFAPGGNPQNGFRRSELMPISNNGTDVTVQGTTTFHFSIKPDTARALNSSHQYELAFIETNDYSSHVWTLKTGTPFNQASGAISKTLRLEGSNANGATAKTLYSVQWDTGSWHNFAITTDWVNNKISAYYSSGNSPLKSVVSSQTNDATGKGVAHLGVLKLPTASTDPVNNGFQSKNLNEGVIYGGIFVESGDVTLDNSRRYH